MVDIPPRYETPLNKGVEARRFSSAAAGCDEYQAARGTVGSRERATLLIGTTREEAVNSWRAPCPRACPQRASSASAASARWRSLRRRDAASGAPAVRFGAAMFSCPAADVPPPFAAWQCQGTSESRQRWMRWPSASNNAGRSPEQCGDRALPGSEPVAVFTPTASRARWASVSSLVAARIHSFQLCSSGS